MNGRWRQYFPHKVLNFYQTSWRHTPEESFLSYCHKNLNYYMLHVRVCCFVMTASLLSTVSHLYQAVFILQAPGMKHGFILRVRQ